MAFIPQTFEDLTVEKAVVRVRVIEMEIYKVSGPYLAWSGRMQV